MAGGTWTTQNKVRPGVYVNVNSAPKALGAIGERGVVTMALPLSWGPEKRVIELQAGADTLPTFGYGIAEPQMLLVREALKRAKTLLLYKLNAGTKATAALDNMTVTALYGGERGNDISVAVQKNMDDNTKCDVKTFVDGQEVDSQTAADVAGLATNGWVSFSGEGPLQESAGIALEGGANGAVTNQDHADYLSAIEVYDFHTMALVSTDASLKSLYASFMKRQRNDEGRKMQLVVENDPAADHEGIISVKNGVVLSDGTTLTAAQATAWVAGATAGANANESLTYQAYEDAVDVEPRLTNSQIEAALRNGEFVFTQLNGRAVVEQDINSFTSFAPDKGKPFSKNRVIRVMDGLANDYKRIFEQFYIGKVDNNDDGRNLFRKECINQAQMYQDMNALQNFDSQKDVNVLPGADGDSIYVELYVQPVDSIEKIYAKVQVR
ncbi:phage tail sheath family protein [Paenibacillus sp. MSJ-34]|uniref:phage tail sheath family protein n=1 Tax=Paenibacillus sp. MSJ-34 TaxID=2841529 RepID=UPI001C115BEB|nr:phage tail sheath family protein [Paenibacillus sp. MSJ-34]MBU5445182.1 phage tail sheath family protein [Paenibacillus sp. MSJ-34]